MESDWEEIELCWYLDEYPNIFEEFPILFSFKFFIRAFNWTAALVIAIILMFLKTGIGNTGIAPL